MTGFIQNMIWNSVEGFVEAGKRTVGGYAGDALIKAGDAIENGGRSVGTGLERKVSGYGTSISGQKYQGPSSSSSGPKKKPLPAPSKPSAIKRSNSSPAAVPPTGIKRIGPTSSTPLGAKKYPSGGAASKKPGTQKKVPIPNPTTGGSGIKSGLASTASKAASSTSSLNKNMPKSYSNNSKNNASSPYPTDKKMAVKPGAPKPFTPPPAPSSTASRDAGKKNVSPYPGTNTKPGEASRTPVRRKFKPMERAAPQADYGKMQHITV